MERHAGFASRIALWLIVVVGGITPMFAAEDGATAEDGAALGLLKSIPASEFTKIIDNSTSPDKRFAVALGSKDGKKPEWAVERYEKDGGPNGISYFLEPCRNYLVDLKADRVTGILDATHFTTREGMNHESAGFTWSPDSRWLVETQSWKWHTATCTVHRLDADGRMSARLDFLKSAAGILDTWLREHAPQLTAEQRGSYAFYASIDSISNDGTLAAGISGEIPKSDDGPLVDLSVAGKLAEEKDGVLSLQGLKVKAAEK